MATQAAITPTNDSNSQTFWVSPLKPLQPQTIALPAGDQTGVTVVQPLAACFKFTPDYDEGRFIEAVKTAAASVVWEIPALAGRIEWEDEDRHRLKCVVPEDPKIKVVIKYHPHLDADELDAAGWAFYHLNMPDMGLSPTVQYGVGTYNFGMQANILRGGVVLMFHMNHIILDGSSQASVESLFGIHMGRALAGKAPRASGLVPEEALDKSVPVGTHPARPMLDWETWKEGSQVSLTPQQIGALMRARRELLCISIWHIPSHKINDLRKRMSRGQQGSSKLSTATNLSTWLWRIVTKARDLDSDAQTKLLTPVQTRGRIAELHQNYIGSALVYGQAKATADEVIAQPPGVLGERIEQSVAWWTPERIKEFWGSIEECDDLGKYKLNTDRDFGTDVEASNIVNFPFYQIPWGRGLEIRAYRIPNIKFGDGWGAFMPRPPKGGVDVGLFLSKESFARLLEDAEFRGDAEFVSASEEKLEHEARKTEHVRAKL